MRIALPHTVAPAVLAAGVLLVAACKEYETGSNSGPVDACGLPAPPIAVQNQFYNDNVLWKYFGPGPLCRVMFPALPAKYTVSVHALDDNSVEKEVLATDIKAYCHPPSVHLGSPTLCEARFAPCVENNTLQIRVLNANGVLEHNWTMRRSAAAPLRAELYQFGQFAEFPAELTVTVSKANKYCVPGAWSVGLPLDSTTIYHQGFNQAGWWVVQEAESGAFRAIAGHYLQFPPTMVFVADPPPKSGGFRIRRFRTSGCDPTIHVVESSVGNAGQTIPKLQMPESDGLSWCGNLDAIPSPEQ